MSPIDAFRLVAGAGFLAAAAVSDLRTREVRDRVWLWMGTVGITLFAADLYARGVDPVLGLVLVPTAVLFYGVFYGQEFVTDQGWRFPPSTAAAYGIALVAAAYPIVDLYRPGDPASMTALRTYGTYLVSPVMMIVFRGMYQARLLKGGADAKAMIGIACLAPTYPDLPPLPLATLDPGLQDAVAIAFPFPFVVLLDAALLFLVLPVAFLAYNASRGHVALPQALVGYRVPLGRIPRFVWFMDRIEGGEHVVVYFPSKRQDREAIARDLRAAGFKEAWVTPQLPFMVPLAIGFVLAFAVGNPIMALLEAVLPGP